MKIKKASDIILILPPKRFKEHRYSLGLMYISGYLRDHGYDNTVIDSKIFGGKDYKYDRKKARQEIIDTVIRLKPKMIGFTATTMEISEVIWLNQQIKSKIGVFSVVGGPHVTASPDETLKSGFDVAVVGEGELAVLDLVKELVKDRPQLAQVKGIAWLDNDKIVINQPQKLIDISDISLPAYDKVNMDFYSEIMDDVIRGFPIKSVMIMASRGCPYACTFCACNKVFGRQVRYRSPASIKKEVELLKEKYKIEGVWFADDTLTVSEEHVKKICQVMNDLGMYWGAQSRVDLTNEKIVKLMKESGCLQLDFGVESGNQRVLDDIIKKRISLSEVETAFTLCRKYSIRTQASFMIGLPTETKKEMEDTFKFARKIRPDYYSFNVLVPLPGTEIYDKYFKGEISLTDYAEIDFHHVSDKFNKSQVKDIETLHNKWRQKLFEGVKRRGLLNFLSVVKIWLKLGNKIERLSYIIFKIKRGIKYIFNKLGFKFSLE